MTETNGDCECAKCQAACEHKPGWFQPGEAERVAELLGLSLQELFETKLGVDWWESTPDIFVLAPSLAGHSPGEEYPGDPEGACVFFKDGQCSIHPVKPFECREHHHDEPTGDRHESVADLWKGNQTQIEELLGRAPEASEYVGSPFGSFGGLF